jgi:glycosyltransferase involved in cell wall biosynthesis
MRVTHVITRLVVGGAQQNTLATIAGLRQKPGLEADLISGPTTGPEGLLEDEARRVAGRLEIVPELVRPVSPLKDFAALRKLERLLRGLRPDIVHTHSGKAGILGRLAAKRAGVPVIIHHIHGPSFGDFQSAPANWIFTAAERYAGRVTDHFFCSAQAMSRRYLAAGIGNPSRYTRIFSGFDLDPFLNAAADPALRARLGLGAGDFVIGSIGRLFRLKGHADLIHAFATVLPRLPRARLLLVGDGVLRPELEALIASLGVTGKVVFAGLVPPEEVSRYVGVMDCLAHLSYREALSRALPQALAAGRPVVAYDFDGADEVCVENETGFLVRTADIAGVAEKLLALAADPEMRRRMGGTGRAFVRQNFSIEKMVNDQYEVYLRFLPRRVGWVAGSE